MFKVHDGSPHEPGVTYLALIETDPGHVMLAAVDQDGNCLEDPASEDHGGGILTITADGKVSRSPNVMPGIGVELDHEYRAALDQFAEGMTAKHAKRSYGGRTPLREVK